MADSDPQINISRIKVAGVGGFGLVVVAAAMALDLPAVRGFIIAGVAGGLIGAAGLVLYRRWVGQRPTGPGSIFMLDRRPIKNGGATPASTTPPDRIVTSAIVAGASSWP